MSDQPIDIKRHRLPEWRMANQGKRKHLGGRWSTERVAEELRDHPDREFTMDDLARLVFGSTSKTNRDKVRKHIPLQRNYMMGRFCPIITRYGSRGVIDTVKLYQFDAPEDIRLMTEELERLRDRKEITEDRYLQLRMLLRLPDKKDQ